MKKALLIYFSLLFVFVSCSLNVSAQVSTLAASADFDNGHIRTNFTIDQKTNTIDYGKCNMNYETWYYYKLT